MSGKRGMLFGGQESAAADEVEADVQVVRTSEPAPETQPSGQMKTVLSAGCSIEGKLVCSGPTRIDGSVTGEIQADALVVVDESATVVGDLDVHEISVSGSVKGNITANGRVSLARSAQIEGDIRTPSLTMEEGAQIQGKVEVEPASQKTQPAAQADAAPFAPAPAPELAEEDFTLPDRAAAPSQFFDGPADSLESEVTISRP